MSKFWIYFKTEAKGVLKQAPQTFGVFLFLPFFFSALMGFSFNTAFIPEVMMDPISIHITNNDQGTMGQAFTEIFETDELTPYFTLETEEDADFLISILPDYSQAIAETHISVEEKPNTSASDKKILNNFIIEWQQNLLNQAELLGEIGAVSDPEKVAILESELVMISEIEQEDVFVSETFESDKALTSNQYSSVTGLIYLLFMTLSSSVSMNTNKDFKGIKKRLGILPLSPTESVLFDFGTSTIIYSLLAGLLVLMWKIYDPTTFVGNPLFYIGWITLYTMLFQALSVALLYIVPEKISGIFLQLFLMLYMLFGFLPIDKIVGGELANFFNQNIIRKLFNQPIYDYILSGDMFGNSQIVFGLTGSVVIILGATIVIRNRRELSYA